MAVKAKTDKVEFLKGAEAETKILEYLIQQNRPHNPTDISANLRVIKKVDAMKCLTYLHEAQKIDMKLFGKQAVYCCKQSDQAVVPPEALQELQNELSELKETVKSLKEKNATLTRELDELGKQPATVEIPIVKSALKQEWLELHSRLAEITKNVGPGEAERPAPQTAAEIAKLDNRLEKYKSLWLSRRKTCKEAVATITDQITDDDARNSFADRLGLENDSTELTSFERAQAENQVGTKAADKNLRQVIGIKRSASGTEKL